MMSILNQIRGKEKPKAFRMRFMDSILILLLGIGLGIFSKFLDCTPSNELPAFLESLDVRNFLGRLAFWVVIGVWISVRSNSAVRASMNVFLFFFGMVASYYLYSWFIAGFFPKRYAMIWIGIAALSPLLAFGCWYAVGKSKTSFVLSVFIIAVLFQMTFAFGWLYIAVRSALELVFFLLAILILKRDSVKGTVMLAVSGSLLGWCMGLLSQFRF